MKVKEISRQHEALPPMDFFTKKLRDYVQENKLVGPRGGPDYKEVAKRCGVNAVTLWRIHEGEAENPSHETMKKLLLLFGMALVPIRLEK